MTRGLSLISQALREGSSVNGSARAGVVYWYEVKPKHGKQEIRKPVRFWSKRERVRLLALAGAEIAREIEELLGSP